MFAPWQLPRKPGVMPWGPGLCKEARLESCVCRTPTLLTLTIARECNEEARETWGLADGLTAVWNGLKRRDETVYQSGRKYQEAWTNPRPEGLAVRSTTFSCWGSPVNSGQ